MKLRKISYLVMSLLFFNLLFVFYYYFKIVNFLYVDFFGFSKLINIVLTNVVILVFDVVYVFISEGLKANSFSYLFNCFLGLIIGLLISILLLNKGDYGIVDYLGIISFFIINVVFLSYSLYFENDKEKVFR